MPYLILRQFIANSSLIHTEFQEKCTHIYRSTVPLFDEGVLGVNVVEERKIGLRAQLTPGSFLGHLHTFLLF